MHLRCWLALGVAVCGSLPAAPVAAEDSTRAVRLVDRAPGTQRIRITGGTQKTVLDPIIGINVVPLPDTLPAQPVLTFATGMQAGDPPVTVRYDIRWKSADGVEERLFSLDRSDPGWVPGRIELAGRDPRGASLVLRRAVVNGRRRDAFRTSWGDPVITAAVDVSAGAPQSVILISLDTLRGDRVGLYGHADAHTPTIDRLGKTGVWYEHAYSPSGWTLPSHMSLLYGDHRKFAPEDPSPGAPPGTTRAPALAEILRAQGFLTAAFTGGGWMSVNFGFARGFDTFYAFPQPTLQPGDCPPERLDGKTVFQQAITWLHDRGRAPFFLLLHTYDVHDRCPFLKPNAPANLPWGPTVNREDLLRFYDQLIGATDGLVGELVAELDRLGVSGNTIIVLTSDHGEFFNEHGMQGHGCLQKPYEQLMHVPLIIRDPRTVKARGGVSEPVSLIDVAPTILRLLNVAIPDSMEGTVLPGLGIEGRQARVPVYSRCDDLVMVRTGRDKLIMSLSRTFPDELYDLSADPGEAANIAGDGQRVTALRTLVSGLVADSARAAATGPTQSIDDGTKERLRALGY